MGGLAAVTPESAVPVLNEIPRLFEPLQNYEKKFIPLVEVPEKEVADSLSKITLKPLPNTDDSFNLDTFMVDFEITILYEMSKIES